MSTKEEFADIIREHQGLLYKVTAIYTNNKQDREDLFQDIVYQLWKYQDTFRNESKLSTWMYRVAMNTAITHLKKTKRTPSPEPINDSLVQMSEVSDDILEERLRLLHQQIQKLNTLEKGIILLLLEGRSYQEIADITGLKTSNVGTRISRIKKKLKENMIKS